MEEKGFITFAFRKQRYFDMAVAMAKSAKMQGTKYPLAIVTDCPKKLEKGVFDIVIEHKKEYGRGMSQKIHVDLYSPFEKTIYIDSDSLFYQSPDILWERLEVPDGFGVEGYGRIGHGEKYYSLTSVDEYLDYFNVKGFPLFNAGLFYFDRSQGVQELFDRVREIYKIYYKLPLKEWNDTPANDEPIFAMVMELKNRKPLPWKHTMGMVWDNYSELENINVVRGEGKYVKNGIKVDPVLIHFNVAYQDMYVYLREILRIKYIGKRNGDFLACREAKFECCWRKIAKKVWMSYMHTLFFFWGIFRKIFPKKKRSNHG